MNNETKCDTVMCDVIIKAIFNRIYTCLNIYLNCSLFMLFLHRQQASLMNSTLRWSSWNWATPGPSSRTRDPKHSSKTLVWIPARPGWTGIAFTKQGLDWARLDRTEPTLGLREHRASERCPLYHSLHSRLPHLLYSVSTVMEKDFLPHVWL